MQGFFSTHPRSSFCVCQNRSLGGGGGGKKPGCARKPRSSRFAEKRSSAILAIKKDVGRGKGSIGASMMAAQDNFCSANQLTAASVAQPPTGPKPLLSSQPL